MPPLADGRHIVLVNLVPPTDELKIDNYPKTNENIYLRAWVVN